MSDRDGSHDLASSSVLARELADRVRTIAGLDDELADRRSTVAWLERELALRRQTLASLERESIPPEAG